MIEPKDRLTFDGNFCDIAKCSYTRFGKYCPDGACSQRKVWERLKEYEDALSCGNCEPVRHGRRISVNEAYCEYKCSVCDGTDTDCSDHYASHSVLDQEYCPLCGARMDGAE